jgi:hypothetical protein
MTEEYIPIQLDIFDTINDSKKDDFKLNITLSELESAIKYIKDNNKTTITLHIGKCTGIGTSIHVSTDWNSETTNITDYSSW